ncbi:YqcI/YcgG family protein [Terribacillus sp. DMT04]|uniref:YqcI/YcgG family protein n=1 Tax=Terribacillus sp. DMT04 TaxID=2850441 RepID=UPI001C2C1C6B|nr:YqcI/YcgG family protein [Terribacillus sp. DMT04]QXE00846.1 YqcI/YcgG family protein [Terribacillus sp. DMT04]
MLPLFEKNDIHADNKELPDWALKAYQPFAETVSKKDFPCYFGIAAQKKGDLRYGFIPHNDWKGALNVINAFTQLMHTQEKKVRRGLFLFFEPEKEEEDLAYYQDYFWRFLQELHEVDDVPWPLERPRDPDHFLFDYHIGGEAYFLFGNTPAYKQRITRDLGPSLVIGLQPRSIFDGLEGDKPAGVKSRGSVRERVEHWDQLPKHPDIGHFGDRDHREWKQYFIGDNAEPDLGKCPFHHKELRDT